MDVQKVYFPATHPEYKEAEYVSSNLAIVHVYFDKIHFMRHERSELFGITDFFSNIGGLLGLCMGISSLSLVEIFYFFVIRLGFNLGIPRREQL